MTQQRFEAGQYYDALTGKHHAPGTPAVVICRRVADYPEGQPPSGAGRGACALCAEPIAYNPAGPHHNRPRVCMQCSGIEPEPLPQGWQP
jgi:hypothetical protein